MLESSARLLRLLALLTSRRSWSGPDLAERLEVTARTLRRDIDKLRTLGYPVRSTSGLAGGYQLGAGTALPPLLLSADEALAVAIGLRSAATGAIVGAEQAALRALSKLEQVLPARIRKRVRALAASTSPMRLVQPLVDAEALATLAGACRDREVVLFAYEDRQGRATKRRVEPHGLVSSESRWYLAAWDLGREDFRSFRVDRLCHLEVTRINFNPRKLPQGSAAAYIAQSVTTGSDQVRVRVLLHAPHASIAPRVSQFMGHVEPYDKGRCVLEVGGRNLHSLGLYIALLDCDFEVLEPPELRDELRKSARRLMRAAKPL